MSSVTFTIYNFIKKIFLGILLNATLGNFQNGRDKIEETLQSLPLLNNVNVKNEKIMSKPKNTQRFFFNFFGGTTTTTTTVNPFLDIFYDLKSILDSLDSVANRLAHILRSINAIGRLLPRSKLKKFKKVRPKRDTDKISETSNVTDKIQTDNLTEINSRRMDAPKLNLIKAKLLNYLEETFHDIDEKLESLQRIKQLYFNNVAYKVGYVVANLDNLAINMRNIKEDVRRNEELWGEEEILNVYDRLKTTQNVINNLLNTLSVISK